MARRTLVAVSRPDGRFDCRYAHWGPANRSRPLGDGWTATDVLHALDAGFDQFQLVVRDGATRRYAVCWLDPTLADPDDIALARTDDPEALQAWWAGRKDAAVGAVADGAPPERVRAALRAVLRRRATAVYLPDDASFLRGGR